MNNRNFINSCKLVTITLFALATSHLQGSKAMASTVLLTTSVITGSTAIATALFLASDAKKIEKIPVNNRTPQQKRLLKASKYRTAIASVLSLASATCLYIGSIFAFSAIKDYRLKQQEREQRWARTRTPRPTFHTSDFEDDDDYDENDSVIAPRFPGGAIVPPRRGAGVNEANWRPYIPPASTDPSEEREVCVVCQEPHITDPADPNHSVFGMFGHECTHPLHITCARNTIQNSTGHNCPCCRATVPAAPAQ